MTDTQPSRAVPSDSAKSALIGLHRQIGMHKEADCDRQHGLCADETVLNAEPGFRPLQKSSEW